jgi:hypothetical protein
MAKDHPNVGGGDAPKDKDSAKEDGSDVLALVRAAGIGGFTPAQK